MQIYRTLHRATSRASIPLHNNGTSLMIAGGECRRRFSQLQNDAPTSEIAKALRDDGCVVIKSMVPPAQISRLNNDMTEALSQTMPGKPANALDDPLPGGMDATVFGRNTKRLGDLINRSRTWREEVVDNDVLHNVSSHALKELGDYWLSTAQMIEIGPGTKAQPLHADGAGWWPFWTMGDAWNPEFTLNFLIATTPTTKANGATGIVRDSQKIKFSEMAKDPTFSFWQVPEERVEQIELDAGDCLILGGRIVHRGGENATDNEFRRILSCTVVSSALTPEEAHPLTLDRDVASKLPERVKRFLGFRSQKTVLGPNVWQDHKGDLKTTIGF